MFSEFLDQIPQILPAGLIPPTNRVCFDRVTDAAAGVLYRYRCASQPGMEYANPALEEVSGYSLSSFFDDPGLIFHLLHPQDRARVKTNLLSSTHETQQVRWVHASGSILQIEQTIIPIYDQSGRLQALEGTACLQDEFSTPRPENISTITDYRARLLEISRRMAENFSSEEIIGHLFQTLEDILQFDQCRIVIHSGQEKLAALLRTVTEHSRLTNIQLLVSQHRTEVNTGILRLPVQSGTNSMEEMSMRLRSGSEVFGSVHFRRDAEQPFEEKELELAHLCLFYASLVFENARLIEEVHPQVEIIQQLIPSHEDLVHPFSMNEVSESVGRQALDITGLDAVSVMSASTHGALKTLYCSGVSQAYLAHLSLDQASMVEGIPVDKPEVLLISDILDLAEDTIPRLLGEAEGFRSMAVCPLISRGTVIATVSCYGARPRQWTLAEKEALDLFARQAGIIFANTRLYTDLEESYAQTVLTLSKAIDARDVYTANHSRRLAEWADRTARRLNCTEEEVRVIRWAALLHDIGKISVPDTILRKAGPLNDEEWEIMRKHPVVGADIVAPFKKMEEITPIIRWHQEKYDGSGYPDGLRGDQIPLGARILTVVDAYGAMTDDRVYRKALSREDALAELQRCSGTHFDSRIVQEFLEVIKAGLPVQ